MHSGLWLDLDKPYTTRRSQTLMWSARKIPSLLLSIFLVTGHRYLMPSRVLGEFSKTMIHFSVVTGTGTVQLFLWNGSVYTLSCPIMCETLETYSDILLLLLFHYFFCFGQAAIPAWKIPSWKLSQHLPFFHSSWLSRGLYALLSLSRDFDEAHRICDVNLLL